MADDHVVTEMYRDEYARLIRVEEQVAQIRTVARLAWSLFVVLLIQTVGFIYAYAQLEQKVEAMDLGKFRSDISTALVVLADHGTELQSVRDENTRIRGIIDELWTVHHDYRNQLDDKTKERFYRSDGDRLEDRIERLENRIFKAE